MHITDILDKDKKKRTITGVDNTTRRNPIAVAAQQRYAGTNAAGCHEPTKYSRKSKHKTPLE